MSEFSYERFRYSVVDVSKELVSIANGTIDWPSDAEVCAKLMWLGIRVNDWAECKFTQFLDYENAVRDMAVAALVAATESYVRRQDSIRAVAMVSR